MNEINGVTPEFMAKPVTNYLISMVAQGEPANPQEMGVEFGKACSILGIDPSAAMVYITPIAVDPSKVSLKELWGDNNRSETRRLLSRDWPELANAITLICGLEGRNDDGDTGIPTP